MRFRDFSSIIRNLPIFNLNDIRKIDPGFHRQQLTDWMDRGYIQSIARGYYSMTDRVINESFLFMSANRLYDPSYISLESALAYYQVIPETVFGVTSISSRKTMQYESKWGLFNYRSVKSLYMFGYEVVGSDRSVKYMIARLEKAVLDYLYLNPRINTVEDFAALRWNKHELIKLKKDILLQDYLKIFGKRSLEFRVGILMRYLNA